MLWVRTAIFLVVLPGTLFFYLPLWLARTPTSSAPLGPLRFLGLPCLLVGSTALLWCMRDFVVRGRGTPSPIDPPRALVVGGLYRFVRNPMYVAGVVILIGHFLWSQAAVLLALHRARVPRLPLVRRTLRGARAFSSVRRGLPGVPRAGSTLGSAARGSVAARFRSAAHQRTAGRHAERSATGMVVASGLGVSAVWSACARSRPPHHLALRARAAFTLI